MESKLYVPLVCAEVWEALEPISPLHSYVVTYTISATRDQ